MRNVLKNLDSLWTIEVRIKALEDNKKMKNFETNFKKFYNKESKNKTKKQAKNKKSPLFDHDKYGFRYRISKDKIFFMHFMNKSTNELSKSDRFLNKVISFVEVSIGIKKITVKSLKTVMLSKSTLLHDFIYKTSLAEFNSKMKQSFSPAGLILENKSLKTENAKAKSRVMFITIDDELYLDIGMTLEYSEKDRWDLLQTSNKIINKLKQDLNNTMGIKEK